jgi:hypothetical protein
VAKLPITGTVSKTTANAASTSAATSSIEASLSVTLDAATLDSIASLPDEQYLLCVVGFRVNAIGAAQTLWSNRSANTGVKIEVTAANAIAASGGNGASINTATGGAIAVNTDYVVTVEVKHGVLSVQLNNASPVTAACELLDGSSTFTVGKDNGAASGYLNGRIYEIVGTKTAQTAARVDYIKRYVASRAAVAW